MTNIKSYKERPSNLTFDGQFYLISLDYKPYILEYFSSK